jgi:hypothetical protein
MTKQHHIEAKTEILDHHGIVPGACKDLNIEEKINAHLELLPVF